jgi:hypothetical protein
VAPPSTFVSAQHAQHSARARAAAPRALPASPRAGPRRADEYMQAGTLPANTVPSANEEEYKQRQTYCDEAAKWLPEIAELGRQVVASEHAEHQVGEESSAHSATSRNSRRTSFSSHAEDSVGSHTHYGRRSRRHHLHFDHSARRLLSFFGHPDLTSANTPFAHGEAAADPQSTRGLDRYLLETILATCPSPIDALTHAVQWGDPHILRTILDSLKHRISPEDLTCPLETALACAAMERTPMRIECVQTLCDADAPPGGIALSALFDPEFTRYALPLRLEEMAKTLKDKLTAHHSRCATVDTHAAMHHHTFGSVVTCPPPVSQAPQSELDL